MLGKQEMEWVQFLNSVRPAFLIAYGIFVVWTVVRWTMGIRSIQQTLRAWIGSVGLAAGICSALLLLLFYMHIWIKGALIAHGAALWLLYYAGICLAVIGLTFGLAGCRWLRRSCTVISLVMVFQWSGQMADSLRQDFLITVAMLVLLGAVGVIYVGFWYFGRTSDGLTGGPGVERN
jgi:hypothetical protein